jgi:hypothetical protein
MLDGGQTAEFLVSVAGKRSGNSLTIRQVTDAAACCDGNPATTPKVVTRFESVSSFTASGAVPQKGSSGKLFIGGVNLHSVLVYKGELYGAQTVSCPGSLWPREGAVKDGSGVSAPPPVPSGAVACAQGR